MVDRLGQIADQLAPLQIEIILMDDNSSDRSAQMLREVNRRDARFRYARLAKNSGSHIAILAGLAQSHAAHARCFLQPICRTLRN